MNIFFVHYIIVHGLIGITLISLGLFVFFQNPKSRLYRYFFLFNASISWWGFCTVFMELAPNPSVALIYDRIALLGIVFIPTLILHTTLEYLGGSKDLRHFLRAAYFISSIFFILSFTPLMAKSVSQKSFVKYFTDPGYAYHFFIVFFSFIMTSAIFFLYKAGNVYKERYGRGQLYLLIATIIAALGGGANFLVPYGIVMPYLVPFGSYSLILYAGVTAYVILRYRLFDIEVIIRETAVFAGIFGFSVGAFVLAMMVSQQILESYIGNRQWVIPAVALLIVTFALRPIEKLVYNVIGKALFKKKYEYQKMLQDAATGMATVRDPKKLLKLIVHILSMKMKLDNASILIYDKKTGQYHLKASRKKNNKTGLLTSINSEDLLIEWLIEKQQPVSREEIEKWLRDETSNSTKSILTSDLVHIRDKMEMLDASVCVPSFYRDELLGILILGKKKSGDFFSQDDLDLFKALADEAAIALKNSQLYFEIDNRAKEIEELYKREHRLFIHASVAFAAAIDARDPYTHGHSERVTNYSLAILDYMGVAPKTEKTPLSRQRLQIAGVLHDIGKIGVSDKILHKPAKLNAKEQAEMERHPVIGAEIVSRIKGLRDITGGIRHHHERYDGKGYPDKLRSDDIPFMAKIIAVADAYDAMTSDRPYRKGLSDDVAKDEIRNNGLTQFDPFMVAGFLKAFELGKIKGSKSLS